MAKAYFSYFRIIFTALMGLALSSCSFDHFDKNTSFTKTLSVPSEHPATKSAPLESPSPSPEPSTAASLAPPVSISPSPAQSLTPAPVKPAPVPAPVAPPVKPPAPIGASIQASSSSGEFAGSYVSEDSDLEIGASKNFILHSQALSALSASPSTQKLCKIEREGMIESIDAEGAHPAIRLNISSEKFSAVQATSADDNFCAEVGKSFSEPHNFTAPIEAAGKGYLALKLDETSTDGASVTTAPGALSGLFFDRDSATNITRAVLQLLPAEYVGAYGGGFLAHLPVPRLTFHLDSKSESFMLIDNECAFSITGHFTAIGSSNSIMLSAQSHAITTAALTNASEKTYSVYFGRLSGGCTQRRENFISQLTGSGLKLEDATATGKYALDFSATGGLNSKYIIRSN